MFRGNMIDVKILLINQPTLLQTKTLFYDRVLEPP